MLFFLFIYKFALFIIKVVRLKLPDFKVHSDYSELFLRDLEIFNATWKGFSTEVDESKQYSVRTVICFKEFTEDLLLETSNKAIEQLVYIAYHVIEHYILNFNVNKPYDLRFLSTQKLAKKILKDSELYYKKFFEKK